MKSIFNLSIFLIIFKINAIIVDRNLLENQKLFYKKTFTNCAAFNAFMLKKESYFQGNLALENDPDFENMYIYFHISSDGIDSSYHMAYNGYSSAILFQFKYHTNEVNQIDPVGGISLRYSSCENNNLVFLNTRQEKVLFELQKINFYAYKQQGDFKYKILVQDTSSKAHLIELLKQLKSDENEKKEKELKAKILNLLLEKQQMLCIVKISHDKNHSSHNTFFFIDKMNNNTLYFYNQNKMWIETEFKLNQSQIKITPDYLTFTAYIDGKSESFTISLNYIEFYKSGDDILVPYGIVLSENKRRYSPRDGNGVQVPSGIVLSENKRRYSPSDLSSEFKEFKEFKKKVPSESDTTKTSEDIELKDFHRLGETTKTSHDDLESQDIPRLESDTTKTSEDIELKDFHRLGETTKTSHDDLESQDIPACEKNIKKEDIYIGKNHLILTYRECKDDTIGHKQMEEESKNKIKNYYQYTDAEVLYDGYKTSIKYLISYENGDTYLVKDKTHYLKFNFRTEQLNIHI